MEKTIDKETLLKRTMWGVDIYAHILRKFYPDETVIKVVGRDCGICKNIRRIKDRHRQKRRHEKAPVQQADSYGEADHRCT